MASLMPGEWDWQKGWGGQDPFGRVAGVPQGGIFGTPPITGGVMGDDPSGPKRDAMMAFAAQLLAGSGASPVRKTFGELVGQSMLAGQQARAVSQDRQQDSRYRNAQIKALEEREQRQQSPFGAIDPDQFTPESLKAFQESGDYGVLQPRNEGQKLGNVNPGDFTPDSLAKFLQSGDYADLRRYVTPANPTVQVVQGVPTVIQPSRTGGAPMVNPLSTLPGEANAAGTIAGAETAAREGAKNEAEAAVNAPKLAEKRRVTLANIDNVMTTVDEALGDVSPATSGIGGKLTKKIPGTPAFDLGQSLTTIKANLGFAELQQMRDASPTGGALGQVAVQELEALQKTRASLEQDQSPEKLKAGLKKIRTHYDNWKRAVEQSQQGVAPTTAKRRYNPATGKIE